MYMNLSSLKLIFITSLATLVFLLLSPIKANAVTFIQENFEGDASVNAPFTVDAPGPVIDVWYGSTQRFGHLGSPQPWVNILGNVSDPDGVSSLTYSLNGGPDSALSIGYDGARLAASGDFNIDIEDTELSSIGPNTVEITAIDTQGNTSVETVTIDYANGNVWPLPYSIDWSTVIDIQDVGQVVDGLWAVEGDGLRTTLPGYDRLVALGDLAWGDYEVQVPITIHTLDNGAIGLGLRWNGHTDYGYPGWQPKSGFVPLGALGIYQVIDDSLGDRLQILDGFGAWAVDDDSGRKLVTGVPYIFKMRVETIQGVGGLFFFKVWEEAQPEPTGWDLTLQEGLQDSQFGSVLLLAHHIDATFGDVTVIPIGDVVTHGLTVNTTGSGTVALNPDQVLYSEGQSVTLTATADPGWIFSGWSGDLTGNTNPATITMDADKTVTATFTEVPKGTYTLSVNTVGNGSVTKAPDQAWYTEGTVVTLTPEAEAGWFFSGWSGDATGSANPLAVTMDGNKTIIATFTNLQPSTYTLTVNTAGSGSVTKAPDQATYTEGTKVTLTPEAEDGWSFVSWSGDASGSVSPLEVTMDSDKTIIATFAEPPNIYTLTVNTVGSGSVTKIPDQTTYVAGTVVSLTPVAAAGWQFSGWSGDLTGNANPATITMEGGHKIVTATFVPKSTYTLTVNTAGSGSVTKNPDQATYTEGTVVMLTPVAATGWFFSGWSGALTGSANPATLVMDSDKLVTARFNASIRPQAFLPFLASTPENP